MNRPLHTFATARAGDKGDTSLIALHPKPGVPAGWLRKQLSPATIAEHFDVAPDAVSIYGPTRPGTIIITIEARLFGGVTRSTSTDPHGKTLSFHLLELEVTSPENSDLVT